MIYFITYNVLLACALLELSDNTVSDTKIVRSKKHFITIRRVPQKSLLLLCSVLLIFLAGTRYNIGIDYESYSRLFDQTRWLGQEWRWIKEFAFADIGLKNEITMYIVFAICTSFNAAIFIYSLISIIPKSVILNRITVYPTVGLLIYFLLFFLGCDMGVIRQCAAMTFIFAASNTIAQKNIKKYILFVVLAFLWHRSSILFAPTYILTRIKVKPFLLATIATMCVPFAYYDASGFINNILRILPPLLTGKYAVRIFNVEAINMWWTTLYRIALFWIMSFLMWKYNNGSLKLTNQNNTNSIRLLNCSYLIVFWGTCGFYLFRRTYAISGRGMYYYFIYDVFLIPILLSKITRMRERYCFFFIFLVLYSALFFSTLQGYANLVPNGFNLPYIPYNNFLF